jgi:hypothetical protein
MSALSSRMKKKIANAIIHFDSGHFGPWINRCPVDWSLVESVPVMVNSECKIIISASIWHLGFVYYLAWECQQTLTWGFNECLRVWFGHKYGGKTC